MSAVNPAWLTWIDGGGINEAGRAIATDSSGNVYVGGYSSTTATTIRFGKNATNVVGRYVRIVRTSSPTVINLAELEIYDQNGVAITTGRTATSSSTFAPFDASNIIDGNYTNFMHTNDDGVGTTWVQVDLGSDKEISGIFLYNRTDCCQDRAIGLTLYVINDANTTVFTGSEITSGQPSYAYGYGFFVKPSTTGDAAYVGKLDSEGNAQWLQWIDGASNEASFTLAIDLNNNVYVSGYSSSPATSIRFGDNASYTKPSTLSSAAFIAKLNSVGVAQWLQWIDGPFSTVDVGYAIAVDMSGNVYIGGESNTTGTSIRFGNTASYVKPATTGYAAFVGKLDSSGVEQWLRWIDGTGTETTWGLSTDSAGNVYFAGRSSSTETTIRFSNSPTFAKPATVGDAAFVGKFNSEGTAQWIQWIDGDVSGVEYGYAVATDPQGNVYVSGYSSQYGTSILFGTDTAYPKPTTSSTAAFVAKLSSGGATQWLQWIDGSLQEQGLSLATDLTGNIYITGFSASSESAIRFGENTSYPKPPTTNEAVFVGKMDSAGVGQWLQWIDGTGNESGRSISVDPFDNVYVTGLSDTTETSIRFGNYAMYTKPSTTGIVGFIAKFTQPKYNNVFTSVVIAPITKNTLTPLAGQDRIYGSGGGSLRRLPTELYPFTTHVFTTASATGRSGPILSAVRSAYASQPWAQSTSPYLNMNRQGIQIWTVPTTGTYRIEVFGANQGRNPTLGAGAGMRGDFNLRIGDQLEILVGQQSISYGSGGANRQTGSGGSYVVKYNANLATMPNPDKVALIQVIAGGGGGVSDDFISDADAQSLSRGTTATSGQNSRTSGTLGLGGENGANGSAYQTTDGGGGYLVNYATQGGLGGLYNVFGADQVGGFGGGGSINNAAADQSAGGGGYSGGGGNISYSGGGGSYSIGSNQRNSTGVNSGTGRVVITRLTIFGAQPITLTGWTDRPIAYGSGGNSLSVTTATTIDNSNYVFYTSTFASGFSTKGLPDNGTLPYASSTFQISDYSAACATFVNSIDTTKTLTLTTPLAYSSVLLANATGNGPNIVDITFTYSDTSVLQFTNQTMQDWFNGNSNVVLDDFGRVLRVSTVTSASFDVRPGNPRIYANSYSLDPAKVLSSITITYRSGSGKTWILAASGV